MSDAKKPGPSEGELLAAKARARVALLDQVERCARDGAHAAAESFARALALVENGAS